MKKILYTIITVAICNYSTAQIKDPKVTEVWEPVPNIIDPGNTSKAPSDAIVLFDGSNLDAWKHHNGNEASWIIKDGYMEVKKESGDIIHMDTK